VSILLILYTYNGRGRPGSGSIFVGGFVFGGLIVAHLVVYMHLKYGAFLILN
jgi:hypothetical protein